MSDVESVGGDGDDGKFDPNDLVFIITEIIAIIIFLNLIFCTFVGCKSRNKNRKSGYDIVKTIDSQSDFSTDTEHQQREINIGDA